MVTNKEKNFISAIAYLYDDEDKVIPFLEDLNATSMEAAVEMIKGAARAMGVTVVD